MKQLKGLIDANTVVGSPIPVREGSVVVPVSQINATAKRIAAGSGTSVVDVNRLIKQFDAMQQMMKQFSGKNMKKMQKKMGRMGGLPGLGGFGF